MTILPAKLRVTASSLGALSKLDSGGQGTVYELAGRTSALGTLPYSDLLYKEYNRSARASLDSDVLDEMAQYAAHLPSGPEGLGDRLAWPLATVERDGAVSGFLMRRAPRQFVVQLRLPSGATQKLAEVQLLLNDKQYLADRGLPVHDRWRLQFLRDTADTLAMLHRCGITVGDLSPKNLLASFTTRPCCFFLDCDTMRMTGRSALPQVETTGWEIQNEEKATIASDSYKFALLAVRLFSGDQDSKDVTALSAVYPPLGQLAQLGLSMEPSVRPAPTSWLPALDAATPLAKTTLPWEQIRSNTAGVAPSRNARIAAPSRGPATAAPPGPRGRRGAPPVPTLSAQAPPRVSVLNYLGRIFGITIVGILGLLFVIGVLTQEDNGSPEGASAASAPVNPASAYKELSLQVGADNAEVRSNLAESWVPQLASARKGLVVNGVIFDYTDIWKEHREVRQKYTQARLVWSDDWPVFKGQDFFVTVLAVPFDTAEGANRWCDQQGIDRDHCFAKLLSQTKGPEGTTRHR